MVISDRTSSGRVLGVNRFYNPPAVRRQLEQQEEVTQQWQVKTKPKLATPPVASPDIDRSVVENRAESDDSSKPSLSSSSSSSSASHSPSPSPPRSMPPVVDLDRFLESTTPRIPPQYFCVTNTRGWRTYNAVELSPYFSLADLWESFEEWSAYGAGVPLVLNGGGRRSGNGQRSDDDVIHASRCGHFVAGV